MKRFLDMFEYNSPVILTFALLATVFYGLSTVLPGDLMGTYFVYQGGFSPLDLLRMFLSALGHASWSHLFGNLSLILLLGPTLEEKYSSKFLLISMLATTFVIGVFYGLFVHKDIIGASGIVYMLILMGSFTGAADKASVDGTSVSAERTKIKIPLTFILVALLYLTREVYNGLFVQNNVAEMGHLLGAFTGILMVHFHKYYWHKN